MISSKISEVCKREKITVKDLAKRVGLSQQKMQRIHSQTSKPNIEFFAAMYRYGIEMNWLMGGKGSMYHTEPANSVVQTGINTGHLVTQVGEPSTVYQVGTSSKLCQFALWWQQHKSSDDHIWLDKQIERAVPEYAIWKTEHIMAICESDK